MIVNLNNSAIWYQIHKNYSLFDEFAEFLIWGILYQKFISSLTVLLCVSCGLLLLKNFELKELRSAHLLDTQTSNNIP